MTSTTATTARLSTEWFKLTAIIVTVFVVSWTIAIGFWRLTNRNPDVTALVLGLLALPLCMLLALWGAAKSIGIRAEAVSVQSAKPAIPSTSADSVTLTPALAIVGTALRSPHGASTEVLASAIADNEARADLDKELVDDYGFPVMTARSEDAEDDVLQDKIAEWLSSQGLQVRFSDEQWRALILATGVAAELASQAASDLMPAEGTPPLLQLRLMLPQHWTIEVRRAATMWIKHTISQYGWPETSLAIPSSPEQDPAAPPAAVLVQLMPITSKETNKQIAMVIACASLIGQDSVDRLAASSALFTSSQSRGQIPGEGAAGLLLTDLHQAQRCGVEYALLGPIKETKRDTSADDARRVDATLLLDLIEQIRQPANVELADIAMVVADTAHRPNRVLELMGLSAPAIPQVDAADDIVRIGLGCGSCGAVPFVTVLALARHYALERNAPVLCIGNEDPYLRSAALVRLPA